MKSSSIKKKHNKSKNVKKYSKNAQFITRDTNILYIVNEYPLAVDVFTAFGLHCTTCIASAFDTVYDGAKLHGMDDEEIDEMIEEANKVLRKDKSIDLNDL